MKKAVDFPGWIEQNPLRADGHLSEAPRKKTAQPEKKLLTFKGE